MRVVLSNYLNGRKLVQIPMRNIEGRRTEGFLMIERAMG
jgi:hypothetical protein